MAIGAAIAAVAPSAFGFLESLDFSGTKQALAMAQKESIQAQAESNVKVAESNATNTLFGGYFTLKSEQEKTKQLQFGGATPASSPVILYGIGALILVILVVISLKNNTKNKK